MTHDYKRNGTAPLFAAMNTLDGSAISMCEDRHRHQDLGALGESGCQQDARTE